MKQIQYNENITATSSLHSKKQYKNTKQSQWAVKTETDRNIPFDSYLLIYEMWVVELFYTALNCCH